MNLTVRLEVRKDCRVRSYRCDELADFSHLETYLHAVSFTNLADSQDFKVSLECGRPPTVKTG